MTTNATGVEKVIAAFPVAFDSAVLDVLVAVYGAA